MICGGDDMSWAARTLQRNILGSWQNQYASRYHHATATERGMFHDGLQVSPLKLILACFSDAQKILVVNAIQSIYRNWRLSLSYVFCVSIARFPSVLIAKSRCRSMMESLWPTMGVRFQWVYAMTIIMGTSIASSLTIMSLGWSVLLPVWCGVRCWYIIWKVHMVI